MAMLANHKPFVLPCTNVRHRHNVCVCHMPHSMQHLPRAHTSMATATTNVVYVYQRPRCISGLFSGFHCIINFDVRRLNWFASGVASGTSRG